MAIAKEFRYKGKTLEELKEMEVREFAKLTPSRTRRSLLRQSQIIEIFIKRCKKKQAKGKALKTQSRELVIVPHFLNWTILVHNGKEFVPVRIRPEMLGRRLGEFSLTRASIKHSAPGIGATRGSAAMSVK